MPIQSEPQFADSFIRAVAQCHLLRMIAFRGPNCLRDGQARKARAAGLDQVGAIGTVVAVPEILQSIFQVVMRDRHSMPSGGSRPSGIVLMRIESMPSPVGPHRS